MDWALLLNRDYTLLTFVSRRRVLKLLAKNKVDVFVNASGVPSVWHNVDVVSSASRFPLPATLLLRERVTRKWRPPKFKRWAMFNRDDWSCQYCGKRLERRDVTIDHVTPRSQGGETNWHNCVTACRGCNKKKDNMTPDQANMCLLRRPVVPHALYFWDSQSNLTWHKDWQLFFDR